MYIPKTTYRIQFSASFTFKDLKKQLPYLEKLGVDTIYASPIFKAQPGSTHGYDVTDFSMLNPELGTQEDFSSLIMKLHELNMGWIQDIVPNHMAFSLDNPYLADVLKNGPDSDYALLFDIYWNHHETPKLMVPVLGGQLAEVIDNDELLIKYRGESFTISYYENDFPLNKASLKHLMILQKELTDNEKTKPVDKATGQKICNHINNNSHLLQELLDLQHYELCHWQITEKKINYRRFFTVNDLICLRQEDYNVFAMTHKLISEYYEKGYFQGVRVDHVDGLLKPGEYLQRLRDLLGKEAYVLVEKILAKDERMPEWPIQGTTGYEYLGAVNELILKNESKHYFTDLYEDYLGGSVDYLTMVKRKKRFILRQRMAGELDNLLDLLKNSSATTGDGLNYREAVSVLLCNFPVYRTYIENKNDASWLSYYEQIAGEHSEWKREFEELKKVFSIRNDNDLMFILRFQQLSGPLAAKGVEDTAFYQYNRFISQNEVGDEPLEFGERSLDFLQYIEERYKSWPLTMNASSTHDTKRGEDTRARLAAISSSPQAWRALVEQLDKFNGRNVPVPNDRYMIIQSLVGAWPLDNVTDEDFKKRFLEFLQKALREGKSQTSWASPNRQYENTCFSYSRALMDNKNSNELLTEFAEKIALNGVIKSLTTTILKFTLPGIPDVYQGNESWNFSFVDPDNRRPVDFKRFDQILDKFHASNDSKTTNSFLSDLWQKNSKEELKILITQKLIQLRQAEQDLLVHGELLPLWAPDDCISFMRKKSGNYLLVLLPLDESANPDLSQLQLPKSAPKAWKNILTNEVVQANENQFNFPFICLKPA